MPLIFIDEAYLRVTKSSEKGYHLDNFLKLFFIKKGPFKILKKYRDLAYELELLL
jgi:hypothetical protein